MIVKITIILLIYAFASSVAQVLFIRDFRVKFFISFNVQAPTIAMIKKKKRKIKILVEKEFFFFF